MAPQKSPAFQFYAKDFLTGTATMSLAERGAYVSLLAHQWDAGDVPAAAKARARILGCTAAEERRIWAAIVSKFAFVNDAFQNARLEEEREKQAEYRRRQSDKGKASAATRRQPESNNGSTTVESRLQPEGQPKLNSSVSGLQSSSSVPSKNDGTPPPRPLISGESNPRTWGKIHGEHITGFCDWVCLPDFLFAEFCRKSGHADKPDGGAAYVRQWAAAVHLGWSGPVGDNLKFWRDRWAESHTTTAPKSPVIQKASSTANADAVQQQIETRRRRAEMEASGMDADAIEAVFEREYEQRKAASA